MKKSNNQILESGVLTQRMQLKPQEVTEFQEFLLLKAQKRTPAQQRNLDIKAVKFKMEDYLKDNNNNQFTALGTFLKLLINAANIKQNRFAEYINLKPSNLNKILNGSRRLNTELAIIISNIFNVDALLLMSIQAKNELLVLQKAKKELTTRYNLAELVSG